MYYVSRIKYDSIAVIPMYLCTVPKLGLVESATASIKLLELTGTIVITGSEADFNRNGY